MLEVTIHIYIRLKYTCHSMAIITDLWNKQSFALKHYNNTFLQCLLGFVHLLSFVASNTYLSLLRLAYLILAKFCFVGKYLLIPQLSKSRSSLISEFNGNIWDLIISSSDYIS